LGQLPDAPKAKLFTLITNTSTILNVKYVSDIAAHHKTMNFKDMQ